MAALQLNEKLVEPGPKEEALFLAIAANDSGKIRQAVRNGASLTTPVHGLPPLFQALRYPAIFNLLRRLGAPIKGVDPYGRTLLHYLASDSMVLSITEPKTGDVFRDYANGLVSGPVDVLRPLEARRKLAEDLIKHGIDLEAKDFAGRTALHYAVQAWDWHAVAMLLRITEWPRLVAPGHFVRKNDPDPFARRSPYFPDIDAEDFKCQTPLISLVRESGLFGRSDHDVIVVGLLLEAGADPARKDHTGLTAEG